MFTIAYYLIALSVFVMIMLIPVVLFGFWFSRTTKELPRTWPEWKMEFSYQYIGMKALIDDFVRKPYDQVELFPQPERVAVVTGGNRGIGLRIVEKLLTCEMTVIIGVRDTKSTQETFNKLIESKELKGKFICETLDVGSMESVRQFAAKVKSNFSKIDLLINNAGIMFAPFKLTDDGFESHWAVNYLGHFLLQHLLMPELKAAGREDLHARIVNISSCAHLLGRINYHDINSNKYYYPAFAYSQSKLAQILATRHLQSLLDAEKANVQVISLHPGIVDTDLFEYSTTAHVPFIKKIFFKTPERGARTPIYAAISPEIEGQGGLYLSNCRKGVLHPTALKTDQCERLFQYSSELLNIKKFGTS